MLVVQAWRYCLNSNKEHSVLVHSRLTSFKYLLACQNEVDLKRANMECSLFKPPDYLQACTNFLNILLLLLFLFLSKMEFYCMQIDQLPINCKTIKLRNFYIL